MATPSVSSQKPPRGGRHNMSFDDAIQTLSRDDRFRATIYAMNTLLQQKGIYSPEEFEFQFVQFAQKTTPTT